MKACFQLPSAAKTYPIAFSEMPPILSKDKQKIL